MRKILFVAVVVAVCTAVLVVAGCGEADKAKTYMEEGDALSKQMRALSDDASFDVAALLAELGVQVSETGDIDPQTITDEVNSQIDSIIEDGEAAIAEYEKILALDDVEDYKAYADERIKAIDSTIVVLKAVKGLMNEIGDSADGKSVSETAAEWAKSNAAVAVDAVRAYTSWREAEKIKKENDLGPAETVEEKPAEESTPSSKP